MIGLLLLIIKEGVLSVEFGLVKLTLLLWLPHAKIPHVLVEVSNVGVLYRQNSGLKFLALTDSTLLHT